MDRYTLAREIATLIPESNGPVKGHLQAAHDLLLRNGDQGITDKQLAALPPGGELTDPMVPGLVAQHSKRHGIKWHLRTRKPFDRRVHLGLWSEISCEAARQLARDIKSGDLTVGMAEQRMVEIASQGLPAAVKLSDAVKLYLDEFPFKSHANERHAKGNLSKLVTLAGDPRIETLTRAVVRDLLIKIERTRGAQAATKTRDALSRCWQFNQGELQERRLTAAEQLISPDQPNPALGMKFASSRQKFPLTSQELANLWTGLIYFDGISDVAKDALELLMLTMGRVNEVAGIRTVDINLDENYIELPTTKSGGAHRLMINGAARHIIDRHYDEVSEWLFPAARGTGHIHPNSINTAMRENVKKLGIERTGQTLKTKGPANTHSIRRAGYTWMQEQGINQGVIDRAVNHAPRGLAKTYGWSAHLWPEVAVALESWGQHLLKLDKSWH